MRNIGFELLPFQQMEIPITDRSQHSLVGGSRIPVDARTGKLEGFPGKDGHFLFARALFEIENLSAQLDLVGKIPRFALGLEFSLRPAPRAPPVAFIRRLAFRLSTMESSRSATIGEILESISRGRGDTDMAYILVVLTISPATMKSGFSLNMTDPG